MIAAYARSQYQSMQVQTSGGKLVIMLYDGMLRFLHVGLDAMRRGDLEAQGYNLARAQAILCHLRGTLDMSAGRIAEDLDRIYLYCQTRLVHANAQDRAADVEEVIRHLSTLREAWVQAESAVSSGTLSAVPLPNAAAQPAVGAAR